VDNDSLTIEKLLEAKEKLSQAGSIIDSIMPGYALMPNIQMVDVVQAKTHRKKRINKKWAKKYGHYAKPKDCYYIFEDTKSIMAHPHTLRRMVNRLVEEGGEQDG